MRTSIPRSTSISARGLLVGIALVSVAALGACSDPDQPAAQGIENQLAEARTALALQGIAHPPAEYVQRLAVEAEARAKVALQGIPARPAAE